MRGATAAMTLPRPITNAPPAVTHFSAVKLLRPPATGRRSGVYKQPRLRATPLSTPRAMLPNGAGAP